MDNDKFITLPQNRARALADRAALRGLLSKDEHERASGADRVNMLKEIAAGDSDIQRLALAAESRFIDLTIHKDTFLDDAALRSDITSDVPLVWKSRYGPMVGVTVGGLHNRPPSTIYTTMDNYAFLNPIIIDVGGIKVPRMAFTQNVEKLGIRTMGMARQAEQLKLKMEQFLLNTVLGQPLGQDIATSLTTYWTNAAGYAGKTVYVADPGVQSGTYETSPLIDASAEQGLTPAVFELLMLQEMKTGRKVQTIHVPVAGFPFRKLLRTATIVANSAVFGAGVTPNASLEAVPPAVWEKMYNTDITSALADGLVISLFGREYKIKANNALPQGYCVVTTDQPAAEVFTITDHTVSVDIDDPKEPLWTEHWEKRSIAIGAPDPWARNLWVMYIGNTSF